MNTKHKNQYHLQANPTLDLINTHSHTALDCASTGGVVPLIAPTLPEATQSCTCEIAHPTQQCPARFTAMRIHHHHSHYEQRPPPPLVSPFNAGTAAASCSMEHISLWSAISVVMASRRAITKAGALLHAKHPRSTEQQQHQHQHRKPEALARRCQ